MKSWKYKYDANEIEVRNGSALELYVNGELQDVKYGVSDNADLFGKLESGETIKASVGGILKVKCSLFIDNALQNPVKS